MVVVMFDPVPLHERGVHLGRHFDGNDIVVLLTIISTALRLFQRGVEVCNKTVLVRFPMGTVELSPAQHSVFDIRLRLVVGVLRHIFILSLSTINVNQNANVCFDYFARIPEF